MNSTISTLLLLWIQPFLSFFIMYSTNFNIPIIIMDSTIFNILYIIDSTIFRILIIMVSTIFNILIITDSTIFCSINCIQYIQFGVWIEHLCLKGFILKLGDERHLVIS